MKSSPETAGPVCLINGAAGGLGQALVEAFLQSGWRVVAATNQKPLAMEHPSLHPLRWDVTEESQAQGAVEECLKKFGRMDLWIHNAGVVADESFWSMSEEQWDRVLQVHVKGAFWGAKAVLPIFHQQRGGQIILISSLGARRGPRGQANYAAAKAALVGMGQSLAREYGPDNVRVNIVFPGVLRTGITAGLKPEHWREFERANVLGRLNDLEEVTRFIAGLASMKNISGQVFALDSRIAAWT